MDSWMEQIKDKEMKKTIFAMAMSVMALAFAACGSKEADNAQEETAKVLTVDEILAAPDAYVDSLITFEGVCSHTCAHGATKMFVLGDNGQLLRVEAGELGSFDTECVNNPVIVTGILKEDRIDEEYLAAWAAENAAKHGDGKGGCQTDNAARGVQSNAVDSQIVEYRARIAERDSIEGKPYLSFYYVEAQSYKIDNQEQPDDSSKQ